MFGGHGSGDLASLGQFRDGETLSKEHLEHSESVWVSQDFEALGSLAERLEASEFDFGGGHTGSVALEGWSLMAGNCAAGGPKDTSIYRNIANYPVVVCLKSLGYWFKRCRFGGVLRFKAGGIPEVFGLTVAPCGLHFRVLGWALLGQTEV